MQMTRTIIPIKNEAEWLGLRREDLTSTMTPALFDLSPYLTVYDLYHAKKGTFDLPFEVNERMRQGSRMEQYAGQEVAIKEGWEVTPLKDYYRIPGSRVGSSFDFEAYDPKRKSKGILEIKALDFFRHKESWSEHEIPADKEIQIRHQMWVADKYDWGVVVAFTSIYDYHKYPFERDREFENGLEAACAKFWDDIDNNREPKPDYYRNSEAIAALYKDAGGDLTDHTGDAEFEAVVARLSRWKAERSQAEKEEDAAKAELHRFLDNEGGAWSDKYKVKAGWTKGSAGKVVTPDMVGQVIGAKNGYRQCIVTELQGDSDGN